MRDEAGKITLAYKQLNERSLHGMKEINLEVDDFEAACAFLQALGMVETSYHETRRESWLLDGVEIEIDTWPWIPQFVELEAKSEAAFSAAVAKLGLQNARTMHGSVDGVYPLYYDVTEQEVISWRAIAFGPVPEWLEAKRRSA